MIMKNAERMKSSAFLYWILIFCEFYWNSLLFLKLCYTNMDNENMNDGRTYRDTYNFDLGYVSALQEFKTWLLNGILSGAISIPTSPILLSGQY